MFDRVPLAPLASTSSSDSEDTPRLEVQLLPSRDVDENEASRRLDIFQTLRGKHSVSRNE